MTTSTLPPSPPRARVHDPGQLARVVPYLLGFVPDDSLVAVGLVRPDAGGTPRVGPLLRMDLDQGDGPLDPGSAWRAVQGPAGAVDADVVLLAYVRGPGAVGDPRADRAELLLRALVARAEASSVRVVDAVLVGEEGWRPVTCPDHRCCPPDLVPLPEPYEVGAVHELVLHGMAPLPSRRDLVALVRPDPEDPWTAPVHRALGRGSALGAAPRPGGQEGLAAWGQLLALVGPDPQDPGDEHPCGCPDSLPGCGDEPTPEDVGRLVRDAIRALTDLGVRDTVCAWLTPGLVPFEVLDSEVRHLALGTLGAPLREDEGERREGVLRLLLRLCRVVPGADAPAVLTTAGLVAWSLERRVEAAAALERAVTLAPDYSMARLALQAVRSSRSYLDVVGGRVVMG